LLAVIGLSTQDVYLRSGGVVGVRRITSAVSQATSGGVTSALIFARRSGAATTTGEPPVNPSLPYPQIMSIKKITFIKKKFRWTLCPRPAL